MHGRHTSHVSTCAFKCAFFIIRLVSDVSYANRVIISLSPGSWSQTNERRVSNRVVAVVRQRDRRARNGTVNISMEDVSIVFASRNELIYLFSPAKKCTQGNEKLGPVLDSQNKRRLSLHPINFRDNALRSRWWTLVPDVGDGKRKSFDTKRHEDSPLRPARGFARSMVLCNSRLANLDSTRRLAYEIRGCFFPRSILFFEWYAPSRIG